MSLALKIDAGALDLHPAGAEPSSRSCSRRSRRRDRDRARVTRRRRRATSSAASTRGGSPRRSARASTTRLRFSPDGLADRTSPCMARRTDGRRRSRSPTAARACPPRRREQVFEKFARWRPSGYEDRPGERASACSSRGAIARTHGGDATLEVAAATGVPSCGSGCRSEGRRDGERAARSPC